MQTTRLELRTAYGPVWREVSTEPPREAYSEEIPVIDIDRINGNLDQRRDLAKDIKAASENTGFFYIKNHGIPDSVIDAAKNAAIAFFRQPVGEKLKVSKSRSMHYNGYNAMGTGKASPSEGLDYREAFMWQYDPKYDPDFKDLDAVPPEVKKWLRGEDFVWDVTANLPGFKNASLAYWSACLQLARKLVRIFALALNLPEHYFDPVTTYPGADGVFNFYPAMTPEQAAASDDVGIGSHTDLQCFTLLWQDTIGGLQVLTKEGQWIKASPIEGTFVVNIGDYLMRLTNDQLKSTVHRVYNRSTVDRLSMPFFFGFNFNEKCGVLPSCFSESNPAKYEPVSCGDWCQLRFKQTDVETNEVSKIAPRA